MWLYLDLITLIWAYLPLIALILPYVPYSPYICILLLRPHLCANNRASGTSPLYTNLKAIGPLLMELLNFEDLGDTSVVSECSLVINLVIDNFCYM